MNSGARHCAGAFPASRDRRDAEIKLVAAHAADDAPAAPAAKKSKATVLTKELVQEELQRLLVDEAEEAEANCTVDELLSALRKTHPAMTVEESALRAFLDEMYEVDVVRDIISMDVESDDDDE